MDPKDKRDLDKLRNEAMEIHSTMRSSLKNVEWIGDELRYDDGSKARRSTMAHDCRYAAKRLREAAELLETAAAKYEARAEKCPKKGSV